MKTTITIISLSAILASLSLWAQETPRRALGGLADHFKQLDCNGDGQLNKDEFTTLATLGQGKYKDRPEVFDRVFERLDTDQDGGLSVEEFKGLSQMRSQNNPLPAPAPQKTDAGKSSTPAVADAPGAYRPGQGAFTAAMQDATWTDAVRKRDVPVRIYAPELKHGKGPFPTIIFSHGGGESREAFTYLGTPWAECGYIVVFLTHQGSDRAVIEAQGGRGIQAMQALAGIDQFQLRPEDVRFVLDKLLSGDPGSELVRGRVDAKRIGMAGQCAGSTTALAMVGARVDLPDKKDATFTDPRFRCAIALSPQPGGGRGRASNFGLNEESWARIQIPTLVMTGTRDFNWIPAIRGNPPLVQMPYDGLPPGDKYLVEIKDAEHNAFTDSVPYYPAREREPRHHVWIQQATTAFLDACLKGDATARDWLEKETLESETHGECRQEQRPAAGPGAATAPAPHEYDFRAVDSFLEQNQSRYGGAAGLILIKDGNVVHRKAYGDFTPERVVPIASASKWISGCVIMALVDEGKLSLDDKASKHLPELKGKKGEITIRQMFSHTHGLPDAPAYHRNTRLTMPEAVRLIFELEPVADPGTALYYSGTGMQAAGRMAEIATGKPWVQIFQEQLAGPCELEHTDYYAFGETQNPNVAGSIQTCLDDYGNIMMMLLGKGVFKGKRVLSEKAVAEMFRNQTGNVPIKRQPFEGYGEADPIAPTWRYGIGCWLEEMDPKTGQASRASSGGAFGCQPFVDYGLGLAGVYLPCSRNMKRNAQGTVYNQATAVYFELKPVIASALAAKLATAASPSPQKAKSSDALNPRMDATGTAKEGAARGSPTAAGGIEPWRLRSGADAKTIGGGGPHSVGVVEILTLRDAKRGKDLPLRVTYPEGQGKFPVIVFSHCVGGKRDDFEPLVRHWASHGYVVLQADHIDSGKAGDDWRNRALDMSFLLDSLDEIGRKAPALAGKMDATRVGAGGHLIGAYASCALVGMKGFQRGGAANPDYGADPRVDAALLLSPQGRGQGLTEKSWEAIDRPMLVAAGSEAPSRRTSNPPEWRTEPYRFAKPGDKYLLWIKGMDNSYAGLARGGVEPEPAAWIRDATTAFWDAHLKQDAGARDRLRAWPVPDADTKGFHLECKSKSPLPLFSPPANGGSLPTAGAEPSDESYKKAADYSAGNGGRAVLVMLDGKVTFERYDNDSTADTATHLHSATKSFWGPAVAAMIEDGLVESFDEPAGKTLTEWKDDPRKSRITVRHLLNLTAGLPQDIVNLQGHDRATLAPDLYKHAVGLKAVIGPGERFQYGPSCFYALGEIMKRKLATKKQTPLGYLKERILNPIGVKIADWVHDASGNPHIPNGAHVTARDWGKFGQWLLQGGQWNGKQIVKKELLEECFKPCKANSGYGLTWWLNQPGGEGVTLRQKSKSDDKGGFIYRDGCPDLAGALGAGQCRMYVIPSRQMVVVRQCDKPQDRYQDDAFLALLLGGGARGSTP